MAHSHCGDDVAEALNRVSWTRSLPKAITVDRGTEFTSIEDARHRIEAWRQDYNDCRPHGALGNLTPSEFAKTITTSEAAEFQLRPVGILG